MTRQRHKGRGSFLGTFLTCVILLVVFIGLSIFVGARKIAIADIWRALTSYDPTRTEDIVIMTLRVPRVIVTLLAGASFAVSGSIMQAITRNPMASPSVLGINAGAALGLCVAMVMMPDATYSKTIMYSFTGAGAAFALIFGIASISKSANSPMRLALVGSAVTAMLNALSQAIATYFKVSQDVTFWQAGGVSGIRMEQAMLMLPWSLAGIILAILISRSVSILSLGEEVAVGLGGKTQLIRFLSGVTVLLLTGSAVAIVGPVGFVGLVVPHIVRYLVGVDYRKVIFISIFAGGLLTVAADVASRIINPPFETPLGALTALIGVPFFIYLAIKKGR